MAEVKEGILGAVVGKVGTVVGVMWRGRNILRAKPLKSSKKATDKQLKQWDKLSLVSTFSSKFKHFVNAHCPAIYNGKKWINGKEQMISKLMKQGIAMYEGEQYVQIDKVLLSIGSLAPAVIKKINRLKTGKYKVQWDNSLVNALTLETDLLTIMAYHDDLNQFVSVPAIGKRGDRYAHFSLPEGWDFGRIYLWSMWKAEDESVHSTSCFHGVMAFEEELAPLSTEQDVSTNSDAGLLSTEEPKEVVLQVDNLLENQEVKKNVEKANVVTPSEVYEKCNALECAEATTTKLIGIGVERVQRVQEEEDIKNNKLKKWTPPGFTRKVKRELLKSDNTLDVKTPESQSDEQSVYENKSILEVLKSVEAQRE
ncbi:DUF6266 family protein [Myroides odoratimimus]|uniref:DUF6266 family protein n=1 Tax=Myroides odoratimimus TaxID=76832 RepID=UPI003101049C